MCLNDTVVLTARGLAHATKLAEKPASSLGAIGYVTKSGTTSLPLLIARNAGLEVMAATCKECYGPYDGTCRKHVSFWRGKLTLAEICMCTESLAAPAIQRTLPGLSEHGSTETCSMLTDAPRCTLCGKVMASSITVQST